MWNISIFQQNSSLTLNVHSPWMFNANIQWYRVGIFKKTLSIKSLWDLILKYIFWNCKQYSFKVSKSDIVTI